MSGSPDRLVYSTDKPGDFPRSDRKKPAARAAASAPPPGVKPGVVYVERSKKGRGGKTVTLVINLPGSEAQKADLLKELKTACGSGGALKDGVLEIQGDHRDKLVARLGAQGLTVKVRGG